MTGFSLMKGGVHRRLMARDQLGVAHLPKFWFRQFAELWPQISVYPNFYADIISLFMSETTAEGEGI